MSNFDVITSEQLGTTYGAMHLCPVKKHASGEECQVWVPGDDKRPCILHDTEAYAVEWRAKWITTALL